MLPIVLIAVLLSEVTICAAVGFRLFGDDVMLRLGELSICITIYLLAVRLLFVLASFAFAGLKNHDRVAQPLGAWMRTIGLEYLATLVAFSLLIPLSFLFAPRLRRIGKGAGRGQPVVLLVHGLLSNQGVWWLFAQRLRRSGALVDSLDLKPMFGDIDDYVGQLKRHIDALALRMRTNAPSGPIILVGHSMGGLVCRAYLARFGAVVGESRIVKLVTLGSPHRGSLSAHFLPGKNLRQMRPECAWLSALPAASSIATTAIYSQHDNLVVPYELGRCEGSGIVCEELRGLGHLSLLFDRAVQDRVQQIIAA